MPNGATWPAPNLLALVRRFRDERDWARFHSSKDLAISISLEASELLECFQWSGGDLEARERDADVAAEAADILIYLAMLADHRGIDLDAAVRAKLEAAAKKYPVEVVKGDREAVRAIHEAARGSAGKSSGEEGGRRAANASTATPLTTPATTETVAARKDVRAPLSPESSADTASATTPAPGLWSPRTQTPPHVFECAAPKGMVSRETPSASPHSQVESLREALEALEKFLETDPAGHWEASADDRVAFVRYAPEVLAVWRLAEPFLGDPPKRRPPLDPHLYEWDGMQAAEAFLDLTRLIHLERMETGAFLRAANSGLVSRLLRTFLAVPPG